jgi:hypothetical protein
MVAAVTIGSFMKRIISWLIYLTVAANAANVTMFVGRTFVPPVPSAPLFPVEPITPTPAIDMNFTTASYSGCTVAGCMQVSRAAQETCYALLSSPAVTYAAANTPCITDQGFGSTYQASTNLLLFSQVFTNAVWHLNTGSPTLTGGVLAPDGTSTAFTLQDNSGSVGFQGISQNVAVTSGNRYPQSWIAKAGANDGRYIQVSYSNTPSTAFSTDFADFDLITCTVTATGASSSVDVTPNYNEAGTQLLANGWCRVWVFDTAVATVTGSVGLGIIPFSTAGRGQAYRGTGRNVIIWASQVESGTVTPYMVSGATSGTRDADVVPATGALATRLTNAQGTLIEDLGVFSFPGGYGASRNGTTDAFITLLTSETLSARVGSASVATTALGSLPLMNGGFVANLGVGWDGSGVEVVGNGGTVVTGAAFGTAGTPYIGSADGTQGFLNANIRRLFAYTTKQSSTTLAALAPNQGTPFPPSTLTYFFSGSGSDSNDCKSSLTACQTITKLNSLSLGAGNTVSLDSTTPFTGCIVLNRTNIPISIAANPIVFQAYNGSQWTLTSDCTDVSNVGNGAITISGVSGITIQDCILRQGAGVTTHGGVFLQTVSGVIQTNDVVQRCDISGFVGTISDGVGDIYFNAISGGGIDQLHLLNNTFHGASGPSSLENNGTQGFGLSNSAGGNHTNSVYQGNLGFNIGGTTNTAGGSPGFTGNCIAHAGYTGGTDQFNLCHDNGGNSASCGGPVAFETFHTGTQTIQFNEAYNQNFVTYPGGGACDNHAIDFDGATKNSFVQYNYTHNNFGGLLFFVESVSGFGWATNAMRYNISEKDGLGWTSAGHASVSFVFGYNFLGQNFYNNTVYQNFLNSSPIVVWSFSYNSTATGTGLIANNIFVHANAGVNIFFWDNNAGTSNINSGWKFLSNDYYLPVGGASAEWQFFTNAFTLAAWQTMQASNGGDAGASIANPTLASAGSGGTLTWTPSTQSPTWPPTANQPSGYVLNGGSPMKSAGTDLQTGGFITGSAGTRDYYANTIPGAGTCWNIGADGSCP